MRFAPSLVLLLAALAIGQPRPATALAPWPLDIESGPLHNHFSERAVVWAERVQLPGAASLQLVFDAVDLAAGQGVLEVVNPVDGEVMRLDERVLKQWALHTAHFNGDALELRLILEPGASGRVAIGRAFVALPRPGIGTAAPDAWCGGVDDRVPSADPRVLRLMSSSTTANGGCTGWLHSTTNTFLTAGHCETAPSLLVVGQFNVPPSLPNGAVQHPPIADQYPVHRQSVRFEDAGVGQDWAVGRLHPNAFGQTAMSRQGNSFAIASALPTFVPPFVVPTIRITGFGGDSDHATRNFTQQTSTGPQAVQLVPEALAFAVDIEPGNSGGPIIDEASGQAIGIVTHSGCEFFLGNNQGQNIFSTDLQTALQAVRGDAALTLSAGPQTSILPGDSTIWSHPGQSLRWVAVLVSSPADFDLETEPRPGAGTLVGSYAGQGAADAVVANGGLGAVAPISGRAFRFSGQGAGTLATREATPLALGRTEMTTLLNNEVLRIYQFEVLTAGSYDLTVGTDAAWSWRLLAPGGNSEWRSWSNGFLAGGAASPFASSLTAANLNLQPGLHALVLSRANGPGGPTAAALRVHLCPSPVGTVLTTIPRPFPSPAEPFQISPSPARWNGVAVLSPFGAQLQIGNVADIAVGSAVYALFDRETGLPCPLSGTISNPINGSATIGQELEASVLPFGSATTVTPIAGDIARLYEFDVPSARLVAFHLDAEGAMGWSFDVQRPSALPEWVGRPRAWAGGLVGRACIQAFLNPGRHALVLFRNDGQAETTSRPIRVYIGDPLSPLALSAGNGLFSFLEGCRNFSIMPIAARWNAVGVTAASNAHRLVLGSASSALANPVQTFAASQYLIADGRSGTIQPTAGQVLREGFSGGTGLIEQAAIGNLPLDTQVQLTWGPNRALALLEFDIAVPGTYELRLGASGGFPMTLGSVKAHVHLRAPDAGFRSSSAAAFGPFDVATTPSSALNLPAGTHCIVLTQWAGAPATSGVLSVQLNRPLPAPLITGTTPATYAIGLEQQTMLVSGANFVPGATLRVDGVAVATSFASANLLSVILPASALWPAGQRQLTVHSPTGQSSAPFSLSGTFTTPLLFNVSPANAVAGSPDLTLDLQGVALSRGAVVRWNSSALTTTWINSSLVRAVIPSAFLAQAGTSAQISIFHPSPGGGTSSPFPFAVIAPFPPFLGNISPNLVIAGTGAQALQVLGSDFTTQSTVLVNGQSVPTAYVTSGQLIATVPSSITDAAGSYSVIVQTAAAGQSSALALTIAGPLVQSLSREPLALAAPGTPIELEVTGDWFHPGSVVYANSDPLVTIFQGQDRLVIQFDSDAQPVTQVVGALVLRVRNSPTAWSDPILLRTGGGASNQGIIERDPPAPARGESYAVSVQDAAPFSPLTMIIDLDPIQSTSFHPVPDPRDDLALNVRPADPGNGTWAALFDGFGLFGPPQGFAQYDAQGRFHAPGFAVPRRNLGLELSVQAIHLDPTTPSGIRLTWVRHKDRL